MKPEIELLSSKTVYTNRWMSVREDQVRRTDGTVGIYGVVEKPDFAVIVAIRGEEVALVQQYRYPVAGRYWEFPQGSWEKANGDPYALARAELKEETGLTAKSITHVGHLYLAYGFCTQAYDVFLATELREGEPTPEQEEVGMLSRFFAWKDLEAMILSGEICDASTVAAFGLMRGRCII